MIDAYYIQEKLFKFWQSLTTIPSGATFKPTFPEVPIYVRVDDKLLVVTDIKIEDQKIILDTENVRSTI